MPERKKDLESEPIKLLINHNFIGSHLKNSKEIVDYLSTLKRADGGKKYDITVFTWKENNDFVESDNIHYFRYDKE